MRKGIFANFSPRVAHWALRLAAICVVSVGGLATFTVSAAQANQYNGLLTSGVSIDSNNVIETGGYVYGAYSWTLPDGMQFGGFAYTSGHFYSWTPSNSVGGISAGFGGNGSSNQPTILFPWTTDCSITNVGHLWTYDGATAGTNDQASCDTNGSTGGWNYDNSEIYNTSPGTNPQTTYQTLWLTMFCQAASCSSNVSSDLSVTNLSGNIDDPWNAPSGGASWGGYNGGWVQTNSRTVVLNDNATDPSGVCALSSSLTGPETVGSGAEGNQNPGVTNVGAEIGEEFEYGLDPCWTGDTDYGSWTIPGGIADGTYNANVYAANAGNYEAQGFSGSGSPTIASYSNSISVDDSTPALSVSPTGTGNAGTVSVTVGPSGIGSVSCSHGGNALSLTPEGGNPGSGAGTYNYDFASNTSGVACSASNGDVNGALVGTVNTPTIQINSSGYTQGDWTSQPVTFTPQVTGVGSDGTTDLSCTVNGTPVGSPSSFVVSASGVDTVACTVEDATYTDVVGSVTFVVDEDTQVPLVRFNTGSGYAATSTYATDPSSASGQNWINNSSSPITIGLIGTENTVLSGVSQMTCIVNGYTSGKQTLTNSGGASSTPFPDTFTLSYTDGGINGQNTIVCSGLSGADVTGADGGTVGSTVTEYVDVANDTWPTVPGHDTDAPTAGECGLSSTLDDGGCAYSDGPSQTAWTTTAQTVKITADNTGGGAPITSITCSGVTMPASSWTASADPQDVDSNNGMTVVATVEPQGGLLSCTASDSATPADTWSLGTYEFPIDSLAPSGYFEPQGYGGAARDVIQVHATDSVSGIAQVVVQATDTSTGQVYAGSALTGNPADGDTAYATHNPGSGLYDLTVHPALLPAGHSFAFQAVATDAAGNTATITTVDPAEGGGPFLLTPGGGGSSSLGDVTQITAAATATGKKPADGKADTQLVSATTLPELPSFVTGASSSSAIRAHIASRSTLVTALAKKKTSACYKDKRVKYHGKTVTRKVREKCPSSKTIKVASLKVPYGKAVRITGTLDDTTANAAVGGAKISVYQTDNATAVTTVAGSTTTNTSGSFSFKLKAGASREITLLYGGSADRRGTAAAFDAGYVGKTTIKVNDRDVQPGAAFRLTGKVYGGDIPSDGAIVQVFYSLPGHTYGWAPFKRAQTNSKGIYKVTLPTARANAGYTYRMRVEIPTQTGWGYQETTSNIVTERVDP